ncbi:MAG: hypothetical protein NUK63_06530 [Candidatus Bathyarchaeum tardum]|nr:MAG: hypothetical protein NUK63_06530 [Candidatus Bathyarchaeum tardum]
MNLKNSLYFLLALILTFTAILSAVYLTQNIILQIIGTVGSGFSLGILVLYLITSVPYFETVSVLLGKAFSFLDFAERGAVAHQIQKSLNFSQEEINNEVKGLFPYPAKVEWVDKDSYIDTDQELVVIRMKEHEANPRNVAYAVVDYVSKGLVPYSRQYLPESIETAIDSTVVRKILYEKDSGAFDYYLTNVLNKKITSPEVQKHIDLMANLDDHGYFTRIYLEEIKELGLSLYPRTYTSAMIETEEFANHLDVLSTRKRGELSKADPFVKRHIKVAFVLIAETHKLKNDGLGNHLLYAQHCIEEGAEVIYLLSRGKKNKHAMVLARAIETGCNMQITNFGEIAETFNDSEVQTMIVELRKKTD